MLVLSRRINERLVLFLPDNREIEILVSDVFEGKVDLGISAPREIKIMKKETHMQDLKRGHGSRINDKPRQRY